MCQDNTFAKPGKTSREAKIRDFWNSFLPIVGNDELLLYGSESKIGRG